MKTYKELLEGPKFGKMSDKELLKWIDKNDTDEPGLGGVFAQQIKTAYQEKKRRGLKK